MRCIRCREEEAEICSDCWEKKLSDIKDFQVKIKEVQELLEKATVKIKIIWGLK